MTEEYRPYPPCEKCGVYSIVASPLVIKEHRERFPNDYNICSGCQHLTLAGTNSTKYYRMYDERIVWDFWAAVSGSYKFDEVFEEEALSYARSIFDCGCSRPFPIYQQDDDTTPEETWGKLDETGIAPPGLSTFCGNCSKDSSELK